MSELTEHSPYMNLKVDRTNNIKTKLVNILKIKRKITRKKTAGSLDVNHIHPECVDVLPVKVT